MSEKSSERAERRVWSPSGVEQQTSTVRALAPVQVTTMAALRDDLILVAQLALDDLPKSEQIVAEVMSANNQLIAAATRAIRPVEREAAEEALARAVRRAALDATPPLAVAPLAAGHTEPSTAAGGAHKLKPPSSGGRVMASPTSTTAKAYEQPGLGRVAKGGLIAVLGLSLLVAAGFGLWQLGLRSGADVTFASTPEVPTSIETATDMALDLVQLEADEPIGAPLRPLEAEPVATAATVETALGRTQPTAVRADVRPAESQTSAPLELQIDMAALREPAAGPPTSLLPLGSNELRIFILHPAEETAATEANMLYSELSGAGELPLVVLRDVGFTVSASRIRYFHEADAQAAGTLSEVLEAPVGDWQLQNFSHISPLPPPGTIEIYVPTP